MSDIIEKESGAVDYTPFFKKAESNLKDPEAVGWLSGHGINIHTAERLGIGYYDPEKHSDMTAVLNTIYNVQGVGELGKVHPVMIIPNGQSYFMGVPTEGGMPPLRPRAGIPTIWNDTALTTSDGAPIVFCPDILDAIALYSIGIDAIGYMGRMTPDSWQTMASTLKTTNLSGPLIFLPPDNTKSNIAPVRDIVELLQNLGVSALCYDYPDLKGEYPGAMATLMSDGASTLYAIYDGLKSWAVEDRKGEREQYLINNSTGGYLDDLQKEIGGRVGRKSISTGFKELDFKLDGGLYPGLYIMGAVSSLGKTTFALQIADFIAEHGHDVLFFTLEQSKAELMAKSLSRITASNDLVYNKPMNARRILYQMGDWIGTTEERTYRDAVDTYRYAIGPRMFMFENDVRYMLKEGELVRDSEGHPVAESDTRIGLDTIRERVRNHKAIMGDDPEHVPVVFIDYLQMLKPDDPTGRKSDKQNMDETVSELRRISKTYQIPIVAISSLNRDAYNQPISMASFKESGAIEYSSDVLLGLQPRGMTNKLTPSGQGNNKDLFEELRDQDNRLLEAVILKNRIGSLGSIPFVLNAPYGRYTEGIRPDDDTDDERAIYDVFKKR